MFRGADVLLPRENSIRGQYLESFVYSQGFEKTIPTRERYSPNYTRSQGNEIAKQNSNKEGKIRAVDGVKHRLDCMFLNGN